MSEINQYGPWIDGWTVECGVIETLKRWLPSAIGEIERYYRIDPGTINYPRVWETQNVFTHDQANALPVGLVVSPGLRRPPERDGSGRYTAAWGVAVAIVDGAGDWPESRRLAQAQGAAVRLALLQNRGYLPQVTKVTWLDEKYDPIPQNLVDKNVMAAQIAFEVEVSGVIDDMQGPLTPTVDPRVPPRPNDPGPWPVSRSVDVEITKEPIE